MAADPAARAIAASAGLPVHASVAEFEAAIAPVAGPPENDPSAAAAGPVVADPPAPTSARSRKRAATAAAAATATGAAAGAAAGGAGSAAGLGGAAGAGAGTSAVGGGSATGPGPAAAVGTAAALGATGDPAARPAARPEQLSADLDAAGDTGPPLAPAAGVAATSETRARSGAATIPIMPTTTIRRGLPGGLAISLGVLAVVALILVVGGYLLLPQATVTVTPVAVPVGPVEFTVRADPDATSIDPVGGVIPATRLSKDFDASGEFQATGERVVQNKATGQVTFSSENTFVPVTIPSGTSVRTGSGVAFVTTQRDHAAQGVLRHRTVPPQRRRRGGQGGTGRQRRSRDDHRSSRRTSRTCWPAPGSQTASATSGGTREGVHPDPAKRHRGGDGQPEQGPRRPVRCLGRRPRRPPDGHDRLPGHGQLGTPIPSVDPTTLVGKEQDTFPLSATATGTVVAVDTSQVDQIAADRISVNIPADHALQAGSVSSTHDGGQADGDLVDFRVTAKAAAIPVLDPAVLRDEIKGKPVAEARRLLERYGTVAIDTWPGFVGVDPDARPAARSEGRGRRGFARHRPARRWRRPRARPHEPAARDRPGRAADRGRGRRRRRLPRAADDDPARP